jgi:hypothetical protein
VVLLVEVVAVRRSHHHEVEEELHQSAVLNIPH